MSLINYRRLRRWLSALHTATVPHPGRHGQNQRNTHKTRQNSSRLVRAKLRGFCPDVLPFQVCIRVPPPRKHYSRGSNTWKVHSMQQVSDRLIILHIDCILVFVIYSFLLVFSLSITRWWIKVAQYRANTLLVINPTNSLTVLHNLSPKRNREPRRRTSLRLRFNHQTSSRC